MKDNYYFDNAATSWPKPEPVYQFMDSFFRSHGVNPGRGGYELAFEADLMIGETRRLLGEFFGYGGDAKRLVFSLNATDSLNTALCGLINPGDHMVITRLEHNSVLRPTNHLERDSNVSVSRIGRDASGYVDPQEIGRAITNKTRVVVVNHGSNVLGSVQDIKAIGAIVRETNAVLIVDSCQTAGVIDIDMDEWGIDVLVFTGHKGLFGPMGIGGMIVGQGVDIRATRSGGTGVDSVSPFQPDDYPYHLETGTPSLSGIAGLHAAQKWFAELGRQQLGKSAPDDVSHKELCRAALLHIHGVEIKHTRQLIEAFEKLDNIVIHGPRDNQPRVATVSINIDGMAASEVGDMLDAEYGVCVRAGIHCAPLAHEDQGTIEAKGSVRLAPGYFTDAEDMERAIEAVADIAEFVAKRKSLTA